MTADFPKGRDFICRHIPHRPPFLLLDQVLALDEERIRAAWETPHDLQALEGHYPGHPIVPGVLLCEAVFQAGALLIAAGTGDPSALEGLPVLTRITGARFKRETGPGERLEIEVCVTERTGGAWFCKGLGRREGKVVLRVDFACALKR